jgi:hypothetical protein
MPNLTLAFGPVTSTDQLLIELVSPPDAPPAILIRWPGQGAPTVCQPARFPAAAVAIIAVCDEAMKAIQALDL